MAELNESQYKRLIELEKKLAAAKRLTKQEESELSGLLANHRGKLSEQLSISKQIAAVSKQRKNAEEGTSKSLTNMLGQLMKGNFQEAISLGYKRQASSFTAKLAASTERIVKNTQKGGTLDGIALADKKKIIELGKGINDGTLDNIDAQRVLESMQGKQGGHYDNARSLLRDIVVESSDHMNITEKIAKISGRTKFILGGTAAIFGALTALAFKFAQMTDKIGAKFGALNISGAKFNDNIMSAGIEVSKLGGSIDDVSDITATLSSQFGIGRLEASKMSAEVFDISKGLALGTSETAKLIGMLMQTSDLSFQQAENLAESTFQLAAAAGVDAPSVLRDLANASEEFAGFTKDGGDNIASAAVQARALGTTLSTTAKIAEGLLDFESSIAKEIEASVLIGRQLNLQKAREAALTGDIEGAMKEVVTQMGSEAEFNNLNVLQRKALADSIGVSTAELSKFVGESDKADAAGKNIGRSFTDILGKDAVSDLTELTGQFNILGASLAKTFGPLLMSLLKVINPFVKGLANIVQSIPSFAPIQTRAIGGPVNSNEAYMVGEKGPELFVSKAAGSIVPNNQLSTAQTKQPTPQPQTIILGTRVSGGDLIIASDLPNAGHKATSFDSLRP